MNKPQSRKLAEDLRGLKDWLCNKQEFERAFLCELSARELDGIPVVVEPPGDGAMKYYVVLVGRGVTEGADRGWLVEFGPYHTEEAAWSARGCDELKYVARSRVLKRAGSGEYLDFLEASILPVPL